MGITGQNGRASESPSRNEHPSNARNFAQELKSRKAGSVMPVPCTLSKRLHWLTINRVIEHQARVRNGYSQDSRRVTWSTVHTGSNSDYGGGRKKWPRRSREQCRRDLHPPTPNATRKTCARPCRRE